MHDAICWNFLLETTLSSITIDYIISLFITTPRNLRLLGVVLVSTTLRFIADIVTNLVMRSNQQVTNSFINLVGTSVTLRIASLLLASTNITNTTHTPCLPDISNASENNKFNEWLAGIIDGDGSFLVSKLGHSCCEITMGENDYHTLMSIKNKLGGSVKLRAGVRAYRYRLHNREGMVNLVNRVNGNIRNSKRVPAFIKVCISLNIPYRPAAALSGTSNAWFSGFFDADGTITAKLDTQSPSITISVSNKEKVDVEPFLVFKGNIYYSKGVYGHYQ